VKTTLLLSSIDQFQILHANSNSVCFVVVLKYDP